MRRCFHVMAIVAVIALGSHYFCSRYAQEKAAGPGEKDCRARRPFD